MTTDNQNVFKLAVPEELGVPPDKLRLRLDFFHQSVLLTDFEGDTTSSRLVSARDIAHALASDLSFSTGLLPANTLWWENTRRGPIFAVYLGAKTRKLALQLTLGQPPRRFNIPLPPFIFLCSPGRAPWVYAVKRLPTKITDAVYKAPLCDVAQSGLSCPGSHRYPERVADIPSSFFVAFFSHSDYRDKSQMYPKDIVSLWTLLEGKKRFPLDDLVRHGTIEDLMMMEK